MTYYKRQEGNEYNESELPALELLCEGLGYTYMEPSDACRLRKKDSEVILYDVLKEQLPELNIWMKKYPEAVDMAIEKIREENFAHFKNHTDTNEIIHAMYTELSMDNLMPLEIPFDLGNGEENQTVHLFNFKEPEKNDFVATNQLKFKTHKGSILPDITIFVNGFPLVIIECKSPNIADPIGEAVRDNLKKYQTSDNGADRLFFYNLFLIATCGGYAKHGCIQEEVDENFYAKWTSTYPYTEQEVENLAKRKPRQQENLIVGMLNKKTLINLLESYVIFDKADDMKIKKMAKHQQLRAVSKTIEKLKITIKSTTNLGGTIWHSQGSGKSLTMFWLSKQIRKNFGDNPILVVTDRTSLDNQIHTNFEAAGWNEPIRVDNSTELIDELRSPEKKVLMTTIQKLGLKSNPDVLTKQRVIVLTDESHRGEFGPTATRMRDALPNAIFFAFTATPIEKPPHRNVFETFGDEIDNYTWAESREDGVTVGIEYMPRWVEIDVEESKLLSAEFEKQFAKFSKSERDMIRKDQVNMKNLRRATERINNIAKSIVTDFNERVGIDGFKAMIVASNREAAVRYKNALDSMPESPKSMIIMTSDFDEVGIEGDSWDKYYFASKERERKAKEFAKSDNDFKILIVSDMLLTGYDAPIIQTMYLDHKLKEHTLLQAIARVNRKYRTKQYGTIIDYVNVAKELDDAKNLFKVEQTRDLTFNKEQLVSELKSQWSKAMEDVKDIDPTDQTSVLTQFAKVNKRDIFYTHYKKFERALDALMPDPEAKKYLDDFANLTSAVLHIRNDLNVGKFSTKPYSNKIQKIIDKFVTSGKITVPIEKIDYDDERFGIEIKKITNKRAQNAVLQGRIEGIIRMKKSDNPVFYNTIEDKLNALLVLKEETEKDSELIFNRMNDVLTESQKEEQRIKELGLENGYEFAVFGELKNILDDEKVCVSASVTIYKKLHPLTDYIDWPNKLTVRKDMEKYIYEILSENNFPDEKIDKLTEEIIVLTGRHLHER
jgi:type I restriction enzyme, R subunit